MNKIKSIPAAIAFFALAGATPVAAQTAGCGSYTLTQEEQELISNQPLAIPQGETPMIQRCDTNLDGAVNIIDIRDIAAHRNQPAADPDDPMDFDQNGVINILDARGCVLACDLPRCAVGAPLAAATTTTTTNTSSVSEPAQCFQRTDLDGDGNEDVAAIFEYTGSEPRGGDWTLETVIIYKDSNDKLQSISFPYSGKRTDESGTGPQVRQHLSVQPPGVINLNPGTLIIDQSAVVSYRDNQPKVIYYFQNGQVNRAFYGIDD